MVCVHPCEVAGTPDKPSVLIDMNAVGCSIHIMMGDTLENLKQRPTFGIHGKLVKAIPDNFGELLADNSIPQRSVRGITI